MDKSMDVNMDVNHKSQNHKKEIFHEHEKHVFLNAQCAKCAECAECAECESERRHEQRSLAIEF